MKKGKAFTYAALLVLGLAGAAVAQGQNGDRTTTRQQGASGRSVTTTGNNPDAIYTPGNPSPNNQVGDHPSSGDDKRGFSSDDAH